MDILINFIFLILGFVLLIKGADYLVNGGSSLARRFQVSELVIGLTIISFGTSAPELVVNGISAYEGANGLVFGNVIGSNLFNILLVLGVSAVLLPMRVSSSTVWREIPFSFFGALILFVMVNDSLIDKSSENVLSRSDGLILLGFFIMFLTYIFSLAKKNRTAQIQSEISEEHSLTMALIFTVGGLIALMFGGDIVVKNAVEFAQSFGVSEKLIGLTVVAAGTSLPELATSAVAAIKGKNDIAIGNVVGSNIFNIFLILGVSSTIHPVAYEMKTNEDIAVLLLASFLLFAFMFTGKKFRLRKTEGAIFLLIFLSYMAYAIVRG